MLRVRWLFFDLGDTIWRSSTPESRRAAGLYAKVGARMQNWLAARGYLLPFDGETIASTIWDQVDMAGNLADHRLELQAEPGEQTQRALRSLGIAVTVEDGRELWSMAQLTAPERGITLMPEVAPVLEALQRHGLDLGIITNRTYGAALTRRDLGCFGIGHYFEHVIVSADVGYQKPHPRIFQAALAAAGARPQDCALVGDNMRADVQGAKDAGLRAIWLRSPHTACDRPVTPDATIERLSDLLSLVAPPAKG